MPVNAKKLAALVKQYGPEKGKDVYYALENKATRAPKIKRKK